MTPAEQTEARAVQSVAIEQIAEIDRILGLYPTRTYRAELLESRAWLTETVVEVGALLGEPVDPRLLTATSGAHN